MIQKLKCLINGIKIYLFCVYLTYIFIWISISNGKMAVLTESANRHEQIELYILMVKVIILNKMCTAFIISNVSKIETVRWEIVKWNIMIEFFYVLFHLMTCLIILIYSVRHAKAITLFIHAVAVPKLHVDSVDTFYTFSLQMKEMNGFLLCVGLTFIFCCSKHAILF